MNYDTVEKPLDYSPPAPETSNSADRSAITIWERASEIFMLAVNVPATDRAAFVTSACGGNDLLRQEVESLLEHDHPEGELEGVFQSAAVMLVDDASLIGRRVGNYLVEAELGQGGMGVVYRAVRADDEYQKQVAIKVVRRGMDTHSMLERFRYERQILASLDHPYIARLIDGGSTEDHRPFFVMEYVQGLPVDEFCRDRALSIEEICRLFVRVCEAVGYAHRSLVVHRDLKPSNIIVTPDGTPKLLDFGVAKLLSPEERPADVTGLLQRRLTPEYASPEQVRGMPVTTSTDVYSLGAVLYELLTRSRIHRTTSTSASEWERSICEEQPEKPSSRNPQLRGDLDNILLMTLRKEPERRYSSVEQLASDVQRFLDGMPVAARNDSFSYRASKYIRRNRLPLSAAVIVVASLLIGTVLAVSQARQARAARAIAEQQRIRAEARSRQAESARVVAEHEHNLAEEQRALALKEASVARNEQRRAERRLGQMVQLANKSLFDVHDVIQKLPGATEARREIVKTTLDFLKTLEKDSGADDNLRLALGAAYFKVGQVQGNPNKPSLGDTAGAEKSYARAEEFVRPLLNTHSRDAEVLGAWIDIETARAELLSVTGRSQNAAHILRAALIYATQLSRLSPDAPHEANLHQNLAMVLRSEHPAEAIEHARQSVDGFTRLVKRTPSDLDLVLALSAVQSVWASILHATDPPAALAHFRESARLREGLVASQPDNAAYKRGLMLAYGQIASVLGDAFQLSAGKDVEGARVYYQKAAKIAVELAASDPANRIAKYDLAQVELRLGALAPSPGAEAESVASLNKARIMFEELVAAEPNVVRYQGPLALAHEYLGIRFQSAGGGWGTDRIQVIARDCGKDLHAQPDRSWQPRPGHHRRAGNCRSPRRNGRHGRCRGLRRSCSSNSSAKSSLHEGR